MGTGEGPLPVPGIIFQEGPAHLRSSIRPRDGWQGFELPASPRTAAWLCCWPSSWRCPTVPELDPGRQGNVDVSSEPPHS